MTKPAAGPGFAQPDAQRLNPGFLFQLECLLVGPFGQLEPDDSPARMTKGTTIAAASNTPSAAPMSLMMAVNDLLARHDARGQEVPYQLF